MKLKMEMVGVGGTTTKQHDGDVSAGDGGCDHLTSGSIRNSSHEYGPTQAQAGLASSSSSSSSPLFFDPDVSDNAFITATDTATAHIGENEKGALTPQDDSPMSHDDYDYNKLDENDIENDNNERQSLCTQQSPSAPSDRDDN